MLHAAHTLRSVAAEFECQVLGEAFLRMHNGTQTVMHLPVVFRGQRPDGEVRIGRIDHGPVVAAYDVPASYSWQVSEILVRNLEETAVISGPVEFHCDPSVGRQEGLIVVPVVEHPADKSAFIATLDALAS